MGERFGRSDGLIHRIQTTHGGRLAESEARKELDLWVTDAARRAERLSWLAMERITTSTFTPKARELARSTRVRLIDGKELAEWLEEMREQE